MEILTPCLLCNNGGRDPDELILEMLKQKSFSTEALAVACGISKHEVLRRLNKLAKYRTVEVSTIKKTFWWRLREAKK